MNNTVTCLNCGETYPFKGANNDELGWHVYHEKCDASHDINIEEYLVPNNTRVITENGEKGIIWGNDADDSDTFDSINYMFIADKFIPNKIWSNDTQFLLRSQFEIIE